jgi:diguanylate cyclase (GGDEF)-like protein
VIAADPQRYERLFDESPCALFTLDRNGRFLEVNRALADWLATEAERLVGALFGGVLTSGSRILFDTRVAPVLAVGGRVDEVVVEIVAPGAQPRPVLLTARAGSDGVSHAVMLDSTQRTSFETQLVLARREAEASARALEALRVSAELFLASSSEDSLLKALTQTFAQTFRPSETIVLTHLGDARWATADGRPVAPWNPPAEPRVLVPTDLTAEEADVLEVALEHPARMSQLLVTPVMHEGQLVAMVLCAFYRPREFDEPAQQLRASIVDNAEVALSRIRLQSRLARSAQEDPLTGLLNRSTLHTHVEAAAAIGGFGLLFIDLDGFKQINDAEGHVAGDAVLVETAGRLRNVMRDNDVVARWGGDEFVIVCFGAGRAGITAIADRVGAAIAAPAEHRVSASIGAVVVRSGATIPADELLALADSAMYRSKQSGRGRVTVTEI